MLLFSCPFLKGYAHFIIYLFEQFLKHIKRNKTIENIETEDCLNAQM